MSSLFWLLVVLTTSVLFRTELVKFFRRFQKYNYLFLCLLLVFINYLIIACHKSIHNLIVFLKYNIDSFRHEMFALMQHVISFQNLEVLTDLMVRLVILGFFIFYPYYYQKKCNSFAYKTQIYSIKMIYAFLTLIFSMIFSCLDI